MKHREIKTETNRDRDRPRPRGSGSVHAYVQEKADMSHVGKTFNSNTTSKFDRRCEREKKSKKTFIDI